MKTPPGSFRAVFWLAAWALLSGTGGSVFARDVSVSLVDTPQGAYLLEGHLYVEATQEEVWRVLTDYEGLGRFVPFIASSIVQNRFPDRLVFRQNAKAGFLIFEKDFHLTLEIREQPRARIEFTETSGREFELYAGSWHLEEANGGVWVHYELKAKERSPVPKFLARWLFKKNARTLLEKVRAEILRRKLSS